VKLASLDDSKKRTKALKTAAAMEGTELLIISHSIKHFGAQRSYVLLRSNY
jgi:hypothetical protein